MKTLGILLLVIAGLAIFASCETETIQITPPHITPIPPGDTVKFSKDVEPLFQTYNCINCHNGTFEFNLKTGHAYNALKTGGYVDKPAATSKLMIRLNINPPHNGTDNFTANQKNRISKWIDDGALNN